MKAPGLRMVAPRTAVFGQEKLPEDRAVVFLTEGRRGVEAKSVIRAVGPLAERDEVDVPRRSRITEVERVLVSLPQPGEQFGVRPEGRRSSWVRQAFQRRTEASIPWASQRFTG